MNDSTSIDATSGESSGVRRMAMTGFCMQWFMALPLAAGMALVAAPGTAFALDELKHEKKTISVCERQLCTMLVKKEAKGSNLRCDLTKTWGEKTIKSAESSTLSWGFGDARCTVKLDVSRANIVQAVTAKDWKFHLGEQQVNCLVEEDGKPKEVVVLVSPKIQFKDGKAEKIWINLKEANGPGGVTGLIKFAAKLSDTVGLFHGQMIKAVNGFIYKGCPKVLASGEEVAEARPVRSKTPRKKPVEKPAAVETPPDVREPPSAATEKSADAPAAKQN